MEIDSTPEIIDKVQRKLVQLKIELEVVKKKRMTTQKKDLKLLKMKFLSKKKNI